MRPFPSMLLGAALAAFLPAPAPAAPPSDYEPGTNWEATIEMEMAGMGLGIGISSGTYSEMSDRKAKYFAVGLPCSLMGAS